MRGRDRLRVVNAVVSTLMMALFLFHGVGNTFQMIGVGTPLSKALSWALVALCAVHAMIGIVLTVDTMRAQREAGTSYPMLNKRFWIVRASGFAIAALMVVHVAIFLKPAGDVVRLSFFGMCQLVLSLLLVLALAIHVLANMEPLMVSLGIPLPGARAADLVLALAVMLVLMAVGFVVYYLRWSVV